MNYLDYKFFHFVIILGYQFLLVSSCFNPKVKQLKLALGFISTILFISGFFLLDRLGIPHKGPYPLWIWVKISIWMILSIAPPIIIKRKPEKAKYAAGFFTILLMIAAAMGIYKL